MRLRRFIFAVFAVLMLALAPAFAEEGETLQLPAPVLDGAVSLEAALVARRSTKDYSADALSLDDLGQVLWAAQGINRPEKGRRTAPSAGALYPVEVYAVVGNVDGLEPGIYNYIPHVHGLRKTRVGDQRNQVAVLAHEQMWIAEAPVVFVITGIIPRTEKKYGRRAKQYVDIEIGHVGQNIYLQAAARGLGARMAGAFKEDALRDLLNDFPDATPLAVMTLGHMKVE